MIETVKDRVSISQLMRDLNLEVVYMPEKEEYFVESEDVNRTGLPLAGYFEYFPYERIQIIGKTEYTYFQNIFCCIFYAPTRTIHKTDLPQYLFFCLWH